MKSTRGTKVASAQRSEERKRNHTVLREEEAAAANEHGIQIAHLKRLIRVFEHPTNTFFEKKNRLNHFLLIVTLFYFSLSLFLLFSVSVCVVYGFRDFVLYLVYNM